MSSTSEVGHAMNVSNFNQLINFCQGFGNAYNPTKESIKLPQLLTLKTQAETSLSNIIPFNIAFNDATNTRIQHFSDLGKLATRVVNAIDSSDATSEKVADAKNFTMKIRGQRATSTSVTSATPPPDTISTSQRSYTQLIQHFEGLIGVAQSEPSYNPNETVVSMTTLQDRLTNMKTSHNAIAAAHTSVTLARNERNTILYHPTDGLVERAADVKKYIKVLFGADSPEYKQINAIKFKKIAI